MIALIIPIIFKTISRMISNPGGKGGINLFWEKDTNVYFLLRLEKNRLRELDTTEERLLTVWVLSN